MAELSKLQLEVDARSAIAAAEALERMNRAAIESEKHSKIKIGTTGTGVTAETQETQKLSKSKADLITVEERRLTALSKLKIAAAEANNSDIAGIDKLRASITQLESLEGSRNTKAISRATTRANSILQETSATGRYYSQVVEGEDRSHIAYINTQAKLNEIGRLHGKNKEQVAAYTAAQNALKSVSASSSKQQIDDANSIAEAYRRLGDSMEKESPFSLGALIRKGGFIGGLVGAASSFYVVSRAIGTFTDMIKGTVTPAIEAAMAFDTMQRSYQALAGSAEQGQNLSNWIRGMARESVVATDAYSAAAKQLLGFGFAVNEVQSILPRLADAAQGNSENFAHLALVYGQVRAQGRAMQQDMYQFVNAGIPIMEAVANVLGKSTSEIRKLVREGEIDLPVFEEAIIRMTSEGGRFFEYTKKRAESATGSLEIFKNEWKETLAAMGTGFLPPITVTLRFATQALQGIAAGSTAKGLVGGSLKAADIANLPPDVLKMALSKLNSEWWKATQIKDYTYALNAEEYKAASANINAAIEEIVTALSQSLMTDTADPWQRRAGIGAGAPKEPKVSADTELVQKAQKELAEKYAAVDQKVLDGSEKAGAEAKQKILQSILDGLYGKGFTYKGTGIQSIVLLSSFLGVTDAKANFEKSQKDNYDRLNEIFDANAADRLSETPLAKTADELDYEKSKANFEKSQKENYDRLNEIFDANAADRMSEIPLANPKVARLIANPPFSIAGYTGAGNIDLIRRPMTPMENGDIATVRSMSTRMGGKEVVLPTIGPNGEQWTNDQAMQNYFQTGQNLGAFDTVAKAEEYAQKLHEMQGALLEISQSGLPDVEKQLQQIDVVQRFQGWIEKAKETEEAMKSLKASFETFAMSAVATTFQTLGEAMATGSLETENWKDAMIDALESLTADLSKLFLSLAFDAAALGPAHYYEALGWLTLAGVSGITSGLIGAQGGATTYDAAAGDPYANYSNDTSKSFGNEGSKTINAIASRSVSTNVSFQVIDQTSKSVSIEQQTTTNADGTKTIKAIVRDVVNTEMAGGSFDKPMRARYGVGVSGRRRM